MSYYLSVCRKSHPSPPNPRDNTTFANNSNKAIREIYLTQNEETPPGSGDTPEEHVYMDIVDPGEEDGYAYANPLM